MPSAVLDVFLLDENVLLAHLQILSRVFVESSTASGTYLLIVEGESAYVGQFFVCFEVGMVNVAPYNDDALRPSSVACTMRCEASALLSLLAGSSPTAAIAGLHADNPTKLTEFLGAFQFSREAYLNFTDARCLRPYVPTARTRSSSSLSGDGGGGGGGFSFSSMRKQLSSAAERTRVAAAATLEAASTAASTAFRSEPSSSEAPLPGAEGLHAVEVAATTEAEAAEAEEAEEQLAMAMAISVSLADEEEAAGAEAALLAVAAAESAAEAEAEAAAPAAEAEAAAPAAETAAPAAEAKSEALPQAEAAAPPPSDGPEMDVD